jgi:hypothetical protein
MLISLVQFTLKVAALVPPFAEADICTVVDVVTGFVTTLKFTLEVPANAVTVLGIDATALAPLTTARLITVSCTNVSGKVTVPTVVFPPVTGLGAKLSREGVMALTVKMAFLVAPLAVADMVTLVLAVI